MQDPTIESQKKFNFLYMQFVPDVVVLECFFLNHIQGILGVNYTLCSAYVLTKWEGIGMELNP
jgi:hypothetical protein